MKTHIGVVARTGPTHIFTTTEEYQSRLAYRQLTRNTEEVLSYQQDKNTHEYLKFSISAEVKRPLRIIKCLFGFVKAHDRDYQKKRR